MEDRGIFALGRTGRRSLRVSRNLGPWVAPLSRGSEPHGGRGPHIWRFRCPAGSRDPEALSRSDRAPGPREKPRVISGPRNSGCCILPGLLPWGLVLLAWAQVPRRWIPFAEPRTKVPPFLHGERLGTSGRLRLKRSHSLLGGSAPILQSWSYRVQGSSLGAGWGSVCQS